MAALDVTPAVSRLDRLCDALHDLVDDGAPLPAALREAATGIADDVERLAGALDRAGDVGALREIIVEARDMLPRNFADFGAAIVDDVIREFRAAASPPAGAASAGSRAIVLLRRPRRGRGSG